MTKTQLPALITALKKIGADYLDAHPKPAKHWFLSGCHSLFYRHHNQASAEQLTALSEIMTEQDLLNAMKTLYNRIQKSFQLLPEIHQCLCEYIPELNARTKYKQQDLDDANPPGGEYTNWGLELPHYQSLIKAYAENQASVILKVANSVSISTKIFSQITAHTAEIPPSSTTPGFLSSLYALFFTLDYQKVSTFAANYLKPPH